jgi:hypothetical protein
MALFDEPDRAGRAVFAIQLRVPAFETLVAHPDPMLQTLETRFSIRVAGAFFHIAKAAPLGSNQRGSQPVVSGLRALTVLRIPGDGRFRFKRSSGCGGRRRR